MRTAERRLRNLSAGFYVNRPVTTASVRCGVTMLRLSSRRTTARDTAARGPLTLNNLLPDRVADEVGEGTETELTHDGGTMRFHCLNADAEG